MLRGELMSPSDIAVTSSGSARYGFRKSYPMRVVGLLSDVGGAVSLSVWLDKQFFTSWSRDGYL